MRGLLRQFSAIRRLALVAVSLLFSSAADAAWYWPFDLDPDSTNKPPRLHRLLEKANDYIELAEDEALAGEGDKAVENYKLALAELDRVEEENPERAETPEFAPLRNKRATCSAAIDAIRFAQINDNVRAVSLTNTKALEKKWRRKHGLQTPEDIEEDKQEEARRKAGKEQAGKPAEGEGEKKQEAAPDGTSVQAPAAAAPSFADRLRAALDELRAKNFAAADAQLAALQKEKPEDLSVLLLRAAAQMGLGQDYAARRTLEAARRADPKSYLPCYNLASLYLKMGEPVSEARAFYAKGRELGGPQSRELEERLK